MNANNSLKFLMLSALAVFISLRVVCQTAFPEVLDKGTLTDQMKYLEEKTRIYENYRAIREDMFQKIKVNTIDTLISAKTRIAGLVKMTGTLNVRIDSLNSSLAGTKESLQEVTRTKNSIKVIGIEVNKILYNTIMWTIAGVLILLLIIGFLAFKRNLVVTRNTKKDYDELRTEYENYRQKSRLEREKMSMDHFNELKKLKGK
jgi:hypothetical protein